MSERLRGFLILTCVALPTTADDVRPALGIPIEPDRLAQLEITIMPDGSNLPPGSGNARAGQAVYEHHCQVCHGPEGRGGPNDPLAGRAGSLDSNRPQLTVGSFWPFATTLFDYVRRTMPYPTPGALAADQTYAVVAYVLYLNGIVTRDEIMSARTLPRVEMPNRDGFTDAPLTRTPHVSPEALHEN